MSAKNIYYSDKYTDDKYEYRLVTIAWLKISMDKLDIRAINWFAFGEPINCVACTIVNLTYVRVSR